MCGPKPTRIPLKLSEQSRCIIKTVENMTVWPAHEWQKTTQEQQQKDSSSTN